MEFPRLLETFNIVPNRRASKTERYAEIESAARFILEGAMKESSRTGKLKNQEDLIAAAAFSACLCRYLGNCGGLDDAEVRELQGFVPGFVFPRVAAGLMQSSGDFRTIVSKGLYKFDSMNKKGKGAQTLDRIEDNITQFICQRDSQYPGVLGQHIGDLK